MQAVVGLFDTDRDSECALSKLDQRGFGKDSIDMVALEGEADDRTDIDESRPMDDRTERRAEGDEVDKDLPYPPLGVASPVTPGGVIGVPNSQTTGTYAPGFVPVPSQWGNLRAHLHHVGLNDEDADFFVRAAHKNGILVVVKAENDQAALAASVIRECNGVTQDRFKEG